jgi:uncharacterized protein YdeI (YjbR/CyaY-like superfamily)
MGRKDLRVDAYIANAAPFARPILTRVRAQEARGHLGRITALADLPADAAFIALVRKAARFNESGARVKRVIRVAPRPAPRVPADLAAALARNRKARATFEAFAPSHRRDYVDWIEGAKRPETRARRLATTIQWLAEGKAHNWRYARK